MTFISMERLTLAAVAVAVLLLVVVLVMAYLLRRASMALEAEQTASYLANEAYRDQVRETHRATQSEIGHLHHHLDKFLQREVPRDKKEGGS